MGDNGWLLLDWLLFGPDGSIWDVDSTSKLIDEFETFVVMLLLVIDMFGDEIGWCWLDEQSVGNEPCVEQVGDDGVVVAAAAANKLGTNG